MKRPSPSDALSYYHRLVDVVSDGVVLVQEEKIALVNRTFLEMINAAHEDIIGKSFLDLLDSKAHEKYKSEIEKIEAGNPPEPCCVASIRFGKEQIDIEMSLVKFDIEGSNAHVIVVKDITERIQLQEAITASESRYTQLFHTSPLAIFTLSPRGIILGINTGAIQLLGFDASEMLKRNISSFMEDESISRELLEEVHQGKTPSGIELQMKRSEGKSVWVSANAQLVDVSGESSIALMVIDIDRRRLAENRERLERDRASLILEIMTHDLSNVNQGILFALELISELQELPQGARRVFSETTWNVRRASRMISNLRFLTQIRDNPPQIEAVDPYSFCMLAIESVQADFPWKKLTVSSNLEEGMAQIVGNTLIEHVAFNILHNSMVYDESSEVIVDIESSIDTIEGVFRIEFSDRGPGIPDSLKEWVFKRTGSPDAQKVGRGLGLTLIDRIVSLLGGSIWVEDRVKGDHTQGAKFVVILPLWVKSEELVCGQEACIEFYQSNHCLFCEPTLEILQNVMEEIGMRTSTLHIINVDDPHSKIKEEELPGLPFIRICEDELTGFLDVDIVRTSLMKLLINPCYPYR